MRQDAHIGILILLTWGIVACAPVTPAMQVATPQATRPSEGYHPLTARTGMEEIDALVDAVASGDVKGLRSLIEFTKAECTRQEGFGGPPKCREGEEEGTIVEALPFLGSEGGFFRRDEMESWPGIDVSGLFAIYQNSSDVYQDEFYPAGEHTILFAGSRDGQPIALRVRDGRIVRIDYMFDFGLDSLDAILQREARNLILEPPSR